MDVIHVGDLGKSSLFENVNPPRPYALSPHVRITPYYESHNHTMNNLTFATIQSQITPKNAEIHQQIAQNKEESGTMAKTI